MSLFASTDPQSLSLYRPAQPHADRIVKALSAGDAEDDVVTGIHLTINGIAAAQSAEEETALLKRRPPPLASRQTAA
jgi:hypothetical protein